MAAAKPTKRVDVEWLHSFRTAPLHANCVCSSSLAICATLAGKALTWQGGMMNKQELVKLFGVASVALPGLLLSASIASAQAISSDGFPASVPKAVCGPTDHTESGLQGETTQQERFGGDSETAYNCNMELVGEEPQDTYLVAYSQDGPAYHDVCAYYGTDRAATGQGIKVIDSSDPAHPQAPAHLPATPP